MGTRRALRGWWCIGLAWALALATCVMCGSYGKVPKVRKMLSKKIARGLPVVNPRMVELVHLVVLLVLLAVLRVHEEVEELVREEVVEELVLEVGEVLVQEEQVPPARLYIQTPDQPLSAAPYYI